MLWDRSERWERAQWGWNASCANSSKSATKGPSLSSGKHTIPPNASVLWLLEKETGYLLDRYAGADDGIRGHKSRLSYRVGPQ